MLEKYLDNLEQEFAKNGYDQFQDLSPEEKYCSLYAYYHYFSADSSKIDEVLSGLCYSKDAANCICGLYVDSEADVETINALIVMLTNGEPFNVSASLAAFRAAEEELIKATKGKSRGPLNAFFSDPDHEPSQVRPMVVKVLTDISAGSAAFKKSLRNCLAITKPAKSFVTFDYVFAPNVENDILEIEDPKEFVDSGSIEIDSGKNVLRFGQEGSLIVNASALSIKNLFENYSYRGLFAQNLRYYIANPKIDANIVDSITSRPDNFWYYNNGIIIICDDYEVVENHINLKDFSIINGGQTTFLIGDTDFSRDFYVQCKIIKNKYADADGKLDFISTVAEATNTQKPIKSKDLVANQREQRMLKKQLANEKIFCSIKRGQKVNKKLYPEPWQNTSNEELAQFIYSFMYQKPGSAKGGKSSLCSNPDKYSLIFGKSYDSAFLKDLLLIKQHFKKWGHQVAKKITKEDGAKGSYRLSVTKYGMFYTIATVGILAKTTYYPDYIQRFLTADLPEEKMEILSQFDIDHHLLNPALKEDDIFAIFDYCCNVIIDAFLYHLEMKPNDTSVANFVKLDSNYCSYVVRNLLYKLQSPLPANLPEIWQRVLYARTSSDEAIDNEIKESFVNSLTTELASRSRLPQEVTDELKEELTKYRTKTFKEHHIKAYVIFKNNARDKIAAYGATTIDDLKELKCLDRAQIKNYGEDILKIVKTVYLRHGM